MGRWTTHDPTNLLHIRRFEEDVRELRNRLPAPPQDDDAEHSDYMAPGITLGCGASFKPGIYRREAPMNS